MDSYLIAPCGMNCGICKAYLRKKNKCPGCRVKDDNKAKSCKNCIIINCEVLQKNNFKYCFTCSKIPCTRLKNLDKRYSSKYNMSMVENLRFIKDKGIDAFLEKEEQKWKCPRCGGVVTCHGGVCVSCGFEKYKK